MAERVFLIHGWSVINTNTYQSLHVKLQNHGYDVENIFLGRYISLDDRVEIRDLSEALHRALDLKLEGNWTSPFHLITHSTGGLIFRHWVIHHYKGDFISDKPLKNAILLAAPHFGSRLAHHGHSMIAQVFKGGETGQQVLNALELGSEVIWDLALDWLDYDNILAKGINIYNLIGDKVDNSISDKIKRKIFPAAYEPGSDMVVRNSSANLNFLYGKLNVDNRTVDAVSEIGGIAYGVFKEFTHSGDRTGIMNSIKKRTLRSNHRALDMILKCLSVDQENSIDNSGQESTYNLVSQELSVITKEARTRYNKTNYNSFSQIVFKIIDTEGYPVNDYVVKLGYYKTEKEKRASNTVSHVHKNKRSPNFFTVYFNHQELSLNYDYYLELDFSSGTNLVSYQPDPLEIKFSGNGISSFVKEDRTTLIEIKIQRVSIDKEEKNKLFVFESADDPRLHIGWDREGSIKSKRGKTK